MTTAHDEHGNPMKGASEVIARYDRAVDRLLRFQPEVVDLASALVGETPETPMGQVLWAYLNLMSTDASDLDTARRALAAIDGAAVNQREAMHASAITSWLDGDWRAAAATLDALSVRWPSDLLALAIGHQLDFFLGDAANLRDRPGRVLGALDPDHPHSGFVRGMQAFGLEESGHYAAAEAAGRAALAVNADDVWAVHAVTHVHEMQGRVDDGITFLAERESDWACGNLFTVHNWWHAALFCLEAGAEVRALRIYDTQIHHGDSAGVPIEMLDASALLWRLLIDGIDTGTRWKALADSWARIADDEPWYAFNDLHALMAMVGAGLLDRARAVIARLTSYVASAGGSSAGVAEHGARTNVAMTAEIGLPACRAVLAFGEDRHEDVVAELAPIRRALHHFGGSHAQRDVLQRTLVESAIRADELDLARTLVSERLALRESSVWTLTRKARLGDQRDGRRAPAPAIAAVDAGAAPADQQARFAAALAAW